MKKILGFLTFWAIATTGYGCETCLKMYIANEIDFCFSMMDYYNPSEEVNQINRLYYKIAILENIENQLKAPCPFEHHNLGKAVLVDVLTVLEDPVNAMLQ